MEPAWVETPNSTIYKERKPKQRTIRESPISQKRSVQRYRAQKEAVYEVAPNVKVRVVNNLVEIVINERRAEGLPVKN
jgi:hypothetical protein